MYLTYSDCRRRFGSSYQIDKAVADGRLKKIEPGIYSDGGRVSELETVQFKYPKGILAFESAYFYHDLTDVIPDAYHLATPSNAPAINDPRVRQHYFPSVIHMVGVAEIDYCGDRVRTYDLERLLIDTARTKSKLSRHPLGDGFLHADLKHNYRILKAPDILCALSLSAPLREMFNWRI